ncbi:hypothetical protein GCM10023192_08300 [Amycolatopsis samaneae]
MHLVPVRAARKLQRDAGVDELINAMQAEVFAISVLRPSDVRERIVETYTPNGATVRQKVSIEVQLPLSTLCAGASRDQALRDGGCSGLSPSRTTLPAELEVVYFPILLAEKGKLQDNFDAYDADGKPLFVLSYREYLKLVAGTLRLLLATGLATQRAKKAELAALCEIAQRRNCDGIVPVSGEKAAWVELLELVKFAGKGARTAGTVAAGLARVLHGHYLVVVATRPDRTGRFIVKYEQTMIPTEALRRRRNWISSALGAKPLQLVVGLKNAATCQSYHVRANCPDHLYLGRQKLSASKETLQSIREGSPTPAYIRFRKRLGQSYGHFYARFFPESPQLQSFREAPSIKFSFYEIPPGSVFRAAVAAIAAFLLVWAVGVVLSRKADIGTDAPAILLAFPAVAATLVGADSPSRGLFDSTLAARLSLIGTAVVSVSSSALFMVYKALSKPEVDSGGIVVRGDIVQYAWPRLPEGWALLGVTSWPWLLLMLAALLNASIVFCTYVMRFAYFAYLGNRRPEEFEYSTVEGDMS